MRIQLFLILVIGWLSSYRQTDISKVRQLYQSAAVSAQDASRLKKLLMDVDSNSAAPLYCYKGAIQMIQAKHSINPMIKLESFGRGKTWIERAISRDTANLEMRFIRYSIQRNLPAFLGYRNALIKDRRLLMAHIRECGDVELKNMIVNYLKNTADPSVSKLKGLVN